MLTIEKVVKIDLCSFCCSNGSYKIAIFGYSKPNGIKCFIRPYQISYSLTNSSQMVLLMSIV